MISREGKFHQCVGIFIVIAVLGRFFPHEMIKHFVIGKVGIQRLQQCFHCKPLLVKHIELDCRE